MCAQWYNKHVWFFLTRQIPANSGWILDGFPVDLTQAYLLEKALGGTINPVSSNCTDLAEDPDTPKAPPTSAPALDLALLLEISDESVGSRAVNPTGMFARCICLKSTHTLNKLWHCE